MGIQKIINFPDPVTASLFGLGALSGFFFPSMLYGAVQSIMNKGPEYLLDKIKNIYGLMTENVVWACLGTAILVGIAFVAKKLLPLITGIIIGFGFRVILITLGFSEPEFMSYWGNATSILPLP